MSGDPLDLPRDEICAQAGLIAHYAKLMGDFAEVGDDHGVAYAFRRGLAHMRMASGALELIISEHNRHEADSREDAA